MKNILTLTGLISFFTYTMDKYPEITFHRDGSFTIGQTRYTTSNDLIQKDPILAAYTIETLKEKDYQLCRRMQHLEEKHKTVLEALENSTQLKKQQLQTRTKTMQELQHTLEQTKVAKQQFEEATARIIHYKQWIVPFYNNLHVIAYMALGYGILTFHNQACGMPSHTYMHEFICNPF